MKTIFITIFEGVESKNILRTDIIKTIMKEEDVRVVLFFKNESRRDYHRAEFEEGERMFFEVVPALPVRGLDAIFMHLKFTLLRTGTTKFLRELALDDRRNYPMYYIGLVANRILARPFFIKIFRFLDLNFIGGVTFCPFFEKYKPDLVFMANLFDEHECTMLRESLRRGIKTVGFINSWDRASARCVLRLVPDTLIVFNDAIKKTIIAHHDIPDEKIFIGGIPQCDYHFQAPYISREEFYKKAHIDLTKKIIVYSPLGNQYSDDDWNMLDCIGRLNDEGKFGKNIAILVRIPPNDYVDEREIAKRPQFAYDYPGKRFSLKKGTDWDMTFEELRYLSDTLYYMSLIICYASSISVDAAVFDKPVININFLIRKNVKLSRSPTLYYGKEHYKEALSTGGIRLVQNVEELITSVNEYLNDPSVDSAARARLAKGQCFFQDGKSGERIGKYVVGFLLGNAQRA